jgi:hypothetical protein
MPSRSKEGTDALPLGLVEEDLILAASAGFKDLLKKDDNIVMCKTDLATMPHCAILAVFPGNAIKILHHFKHDVKNAI